MIRITSGKSSLNRRNKIARLTKGYRKVNQTKEQLVQSLYDSFIGRKHRKRNFRESWILQISNCCKMYNISYSTMIGKLRKLNIFINRKMLSHIISKDFSTFKFILHLIKK